MTSVFLDTSYIIALEAKDDQHHKVALKHWKRVITRLPLLVTTSYVFDEIITFFNGRDQHTKALDIGKRLMTSPSVRLIHVDEAMFHEAWLYLGERSDKSYSFTDCVSFVVMNRLGIETAFTFDQHFIQAGFNRVP